MSFDLQLQGPRALVTGGTRGVGAAVVQGLRAAGVQVMATARSVPAQSTEGVWHVAADLSAVQGVAEIARAVQACWGGVDILVAGRHPAGPAGDAPGSRRPDHLPRVTARGLDFGLGASDRRRHRSNGLERVCAE